MAYDEGLAFRVREALAHQSDVFEKSMFGGLAFLIGGSMSVGIVGEDLLVRVGTERHEAALARPHARIMDFTGRPMRGWIFVAPAGIEEDDVLGSWIAWGVETALTAPKTKARPQVKKTARAPKAAAPKPKAKPPTAKPRHR